MVENKVAQEVTQMTVRLEKACSQKVRRYSASACSSFGMYAGHDCVLSIITSRCDRHAG